MAAAHRRGAGPAESDALTGWGRARPAAASPVLAPIIIRQSRHAPIVVLEPAEYRKRDEFARLVVRG